MQQQQQQHRSPPPPRPRDGLGAAVTNGSVTADVDESHHGDVGFDGTTVLLYDGASHVTATSSDGAGGGASPYALYEPAYAHRQQQQQQQGVLGSAAAAAWGGGAVLPVYAPPSTYLAPPPPAASADDGRGGGGVGVLGVDADTAVSSSSASDELPLPLHAPRLRVPLDLPLEHTTLLDLLATAVVQGGPTTEEEVVRRELGRGNEAFAFLSRKFNDPSMLYYRWRLYTLLQGDSLVAWRAEPFRLEDARRAYVWVPPPPLHVGADCLVGLHQPELLLDSAWAAAVSGASESRSTTAAAAAAAVVEDARDGDGDDVIARTTRHGGRRRTTKRRRGADGDEDGGGSSSSSGSRMPSSTSSNSDNDGNGDDADNDDAQRQRQRQRRRESVDEQSRSVAAAANADGAATSVAASTDAPEHPPLRLPPPSALWVSRQCTAHHHVFAVLQPHLLAEWAALLNPHTIAEPSTVTRDGGNSDGGTTTSVAALCARWLRREAIASRMLFAVRHADAIHHLLSVLLDAVVKVAYVATAAARAPPQQQQPQQRDESVDSSVYCVEALWYLFVLHDIVMNASNVVEAAATQTCVNKTTTAKQQQQQQAGDGDDAFATDSTADAMEALYTALKRQRATAHTATANSPPPSPVPVQAALANSRLRRRQRNPQRRTPYEHCGDALEMILPTLMEACTAIALAVSMDKERQRSAAGTAPSAARVRHVKVLPPQSAQQQQQQQQQSTPKAKGKSRPVESDHAASMLSLPTTAGGGPALSLRLDAGCDAMASATDAASPSSAPAVLLLHWLKTLLIVWMNVEQPLSLPPAAAAATAAVPPGTVWPDLATDAADLQEVKLFYHVNPLHASLLGLDAATSQQQQQQQREAAVYHQPPLLSARACAVLRDRYDFLF
ncbi:Surp module [Novymonas esmeraldas]|uniref:Surp module n=1 Tax=Novymonas esmeraldas TaxID=1808958 RepID=A0AAW0ES82_9TRYP